MLFFLGGGLFYERQGSFKSGQMRTFNVDLNLANVVIWIFNIVAYNFIFVIDIEHDLDDRIYAIFS